MQDVEPGARKYGVRYERGVMPHELYEDTPSIGTLPMCSHSLDPYLST